MAREIIWTAIAVYQRRQVLRYWKQRNKSNAYPKRLIKIINDRLRLLAEYLFLARKTNHKDLRVNTLGDYSLYFRLSEDKLIIYIFWDNRRDPKELLNQLSHLS